MAESSNFSQNFCVHPLKLHKIPLFFFFHFMQNSSVTRSPEYPLSSMAVFHAENLSLLSENSEDKMNEIVRLLITKNALSR